MESFGPSTVNTRWRLEIDGTFTESSVGIRQDAYMCYFFVVGAKFGLDIVS